MERHASRALSGAVADAASTYQVEDHGHYFLATHVAGVPGGVIRFYDSLPGELTFSGRLPGGYSKPCTGLVLSGATADSGLVALELVARSMQDHYRAALEAGVL